MRIELGVRKLFERNLIFNWSCSGSIFKYMQVSSLQRHAVISYLSDSVASVNLREMYSRKLLEISLQEASGIQPVKKLLKP